MTKEKDSKMGLGISSSSFDTARRVIVNEPVISKNPNPNNYEFIRFQEYSDFLILELKYPNCTNYEGHKILLFKGISMIEILRQKAIDPHFSENEDFFSPIARFVPTDDGWLMAQFVAREFIPFLGA